MQTTTEDKLLSLPDDAISDEFKLISRRSFDNKETGEFIDPDIGLVHVLSARCTILQGNPGNLPEPYDALDDYIRFLKGIEIAKKIAAKRLGISAEKLSQEQCIIPILYNGLDIHNEHLKKAIKKGMIAYPANKIIISKLDPRFQHTGGQMASLSDVFDEGCVKGHQGDEDIDLAKVNRIAIVTSAYHAPRTARTVSADSPALRLGKDPESNSPLESKIFYIFVADPEFTRTNALADKVGEHKRILSYPFGTNPAISLFTTSNVFFSPTQVFEQQSFNLQSRSLTYKLPEEEKDSAKSYNTDEELCDPSYISTY